MLDEAGLETALGRYVEDYSQRNRTRVGREVSPGLGRLPPDVELALFRLVHQALETARKVSPSVASQVKIALVRTAGEREVRLTAECVAQEIAFRRRVHSFIDKIIPLRGPQSMEV